MQVRYKKDMEKYIAMGGELTKGELKELARAERKRNADSAGMDDDEKTNTLGPVRSAVRTAQHTLGDRTPSPIVFVY